MKFNVLKFVNILSVIVILTPFMLSPLSKVYAETTEQQVTEDSSKSNDLKLGDSNILSALEQGQEDNPSEETQINDEHETQEVIVPERTSESESNILQEASVEGQDKEEMQNTEIADDIEFKFNVGEYLEVNADEKFNVDINVNTPVEKFRLILPKGSTVFFSDEKERSHIQNLSDGSSVWLITFNNKNSDFVAELQLAESGQITVEDSNGEISAAFLYVNTGIEGRNSDIRSEADARTSVNVSSWANFRTAWNNANRTVIVVTTQISSAAATLNVRSTPIQITGLISGSGYPQINGSSQHVLSNTSTTSVSSHILLLNFGISGNIFEVSTLGTEVGISIFSSQVNQLVVNNGGRINVSAVLNIGTLTIVGGGLVSTNTTIQAQTLNLPDTYHIMNTTGRQAISVPNLSIGSSLMTWDFNNTSNRPDRGWRSLSAEIVNNVITSSSNSTFTDEQFKIAESSQIRSWGFGGVEPVESFELTLTASPTAGGNPTAGSASIVEGGTTILTANPASGYSFSRWEIVSG
ncbi:InlB B-repeat-containing protein, partial [Enterococcus innesii]|uniref:InlB B-repeat-containing protein n=1 Tax=Enterococcus innesii TaxID=2839759 RepID=UPI0039849C33